MIKNPLANAGDKRDVGSVPGLRRSCGEAQQTTLAFLPGESHGHRVAELDMTKAT